VEAHFAMPLPPGAASPAVGSMRSAAPQASPAADPFKSDPEEVLDIDELRQKLAPILVEACKDPALHGAYVFRWEPDDAPGGENRLKVEVLVESSRAAEQLQTLKNLLGPQVRITRHHPLPLRKLLADLRPMVEARLKMKGSFVQGGYFSPTVMKDSTSDPELILYGRLANDTHGEQIIDECSKLMDEEPAWNRIANPPASLAIAPVNKGLRKYAPSPKMKEDATRVHHALWEDERLHGVWAELAECFDHEEDFLYYDVYVRVDARRAAQQRREIRKLLDQLGRRYKVVDDVALPLSELLATINLNIEARPGFEGCLVEDAYYAPLENQETGANVVLLGRVSQQEQRDMIVEKAFAPAMEGDLRWKPFLADFVPDPRELAIEEPSIERARYLYSEGMEQFWQHRFDAASRAFEYASVDAPSMIEYRYWRILSLMKMGRSQDAYDLMVAVVRRGISPPDYRRVMRSLERVQGPARIQMLELENRARREFYTVRRINNPSRPVPPGTTSPAAPDLTAHTSSEPN
jgi:hypothetical protein